MKSNVRLVAGSVGRFAGAAFRGIRGASESLVGNAAHSLDSIADRTSSESAVESAVSLKERLEADSKSEFASGFSVDRVELWRHWCDLIEGNNTDDPAASPRPTSVCPPMKLSPSTIAQDIIHTPSPDAMKCTASSIDDQRLQPPERVVNENKGCESTVSLQDCTVSSPSPTAVLPTDPELLQVAQPSTSTDSPEGPEPKSIGDQPAEEDISEVSKPLVASVVANVDACRASQCFDPTKSSYRFHTLYRNKSYLNDFHDKKAVEPVVLSFYQVLLRSCALEHVLSGVIDDPPFEGFVPDSDTQWFRVLQRLLSHTLLGDPEENGRLVLSLVDGARHCARDGSLRKDLLSASTRLVLHLQRHWTDVDTAERRSDEAHRGEGVADAPEGSKGVSDASNDGEGVVDVPEDAEAALSAVASLSAEEIARVAQTRKDRYTKLERMLEALHGTNPPRAFSPSSPSRPLEIIATPPSEDNPGTESLGKDDLREGVALCHSSASNGAESEAVCPQKNESIPVTTNNARATHEDVNTTVQGLVELARQTKLAQETAERESSLFDTQLRETKEFHEQKQRAAASQLDDINNEINALQEEESQLLQRLRVVRARKQKEEEKKTRLNEEQATWLQSYTTMCDSLSSMFEEAHQEAELAALDAKYFSAVAATAQEHADRIAELQKVSVANSCGLSAQSVHALGSAAIGLVAVRLKQLQNSGSLIGFLVSEISSLKEKKKQMLEIGLAELTSKQTQPMIERFEEKLSRGISEAHAYARDATSVAEKCLKILENAQTSCPSIGDLSFVPRVLLELRDRLLALVATLPEDPTPQL
eukprot:Rmarinus@m.17038